MYLGREGREGRKGSATESREDPNFAIISVWIIRKYFLYSNRATSPKMLTQGKFLRLKLPHPLKY